MQLYTHFFRLTGWGIGVVLRSEYPGVNPGDHMYGVFSKLSHLVSPTTREFTSHQNTNNTPFIPISRSGLLFITSIIYHCPLLLALWECLVGPFDTLQALIISPPAQEKLHIWVGRNFRMLRRCEASLVAQIGPGLNPVIGADCFCLWRWRFVPFISSHSLNLLFF